MRFPSDPVTDGMLLGKHDPNDRETIRREAFIELLCLLAEHVEEICGIDQNDLNSAINSAADEMTTRVTGYRDEVIDWYENVRSEALEGSASELEENLSDSMHVPEHEIEINNIDIDIPVEEKNAVDLADDGLLFKLSNLLDISKTELQLMMK